MKKKLLIFLLIFGLISIQSYCQADTTIYTYYPNGNLKEVTKYNLTLSKEELLETYKGLSFPEVMSKVIIVYDKYGIRDGQQI